MYYFSKDISSEGISDIDSVDSYLSDDSSFNIVLDTAQKKKKFYTRHLYENLLTSKKPCTKEIPLKTPNSSSCSKVNAALALSTTYQQESATNYSCPLHNQSNTGISQVNEGASTSINHEHVDYTKNGSVKEHAFEIEFDAENPDEISSSPNASASINPEHHDCTENSLQSVKEHVFESQLDGKNPDEISSSPNVFAADLPEIPFPIETCNTESEHINKLQNLVVQEFAQNSDFDLKNEEVPPDYFRVENDEHPTQFQ